MAEYEHTFKLKNLHKDLPSEERRLAVGRRMELFAKSPFGFDFTNIRIDEPILIEENLEEQ